MINQLPQRTVVVDCPFRGGAAGQLPLVSWNAHSWWLIEAIQPCEIKVWMPSLNHWFINLEPYQPGYSLAIHSMLFTIVGTQILPGHSPWCRPTPWIPMVSAPTHVELDISAVNDSSMPSFHSLSVLFCGYWPSLGMAMELFN